MQAITPGYRYVLENFEGAPNGQTVQFIHKEPAEPGSEQFVTVGDGTTNEEVLRMMIARFQFLQQKSPCRQNAIIITKLEESLMWSENTAGAALSSAMLAQHKP